MSELQQRRDAQTRTELSAAAIALFSERGYDATTMEDVAKAAGVSRRTAYRHFANKQDLMFEPAQAWGEVFTATVASREQGESTRDLCSRAVLDVAGLIEDHRDVILAGMQVIIETPALQARYGRTNRDWLERYLALLSPDISADDAGAVMQVATLAGALVGGTDGALVYWMLHPDVSLIELTKNVLDLVEPLWPEESR